MMKGRDHHHNNNNHHHHGKGAPAAADLLVCFPSRAHLSLMPKPICSPARPPEPGKRLHHHPRKSPLMWPAAKPKSIAGGSRDELASEPTSPKVTCAGQIKVRHKAAPCKSWQSVMEEIEKLHVSNNRRREKEKKKRRAGGWSDALGLKREVVQFLTCLRTFRLDFRCFGSFPAGADVTSEEDDDDEEEEEEEELQLEKDQTESSSRTVFSKWFMVLQEEQKITDGRVVVDEDEPAVPPSNALFLMRCRSAPAKSLERGGGDDVAAAKEESKRSLRLLMDDEDVKTTTEKDGEDEESSVVVMYRNRVCDISSDIATETWIVGGIRDVLSRSRSWKR